jgi:hypothetical protein
MILFQPFGSGGSSVKLHSLLPSGDILVYGKVRNGEYHEGWIGGLAMELYVSALLRDLLGVQGFPAAVCNWGRQHM